MKVFYSWQSDLDSKFNRNFIKSSLETACKNLSANLSVEDRVDVDYDTRGIPGTPDIASTILDKITQSSIFVADISFVAERSENSRKLSNPNVLIELGYAFGKLGSDRVICILNTTTGSVDDLPFDLKHKRHPIQYSVNSISTDTAGEKKTLSKRLESALKPMVLADKARSKKAILQTSPTRTQIFDALLASDSEQDWKQIVIGDGSKVTFYFKENPNLRFELSYDDEGTHLSDFREDWANKHPDSNANSYYTNFYFNSSLIEQYILVSVDGGRAMLPLPRGRNDLYVSPIEYKVAQIHDSLRTLEDYMFRSDLKLTPENTVA